MSVVAPDVLNSFGGDGGREEFRETWTFARPERSRVWAVLSLMLALGGPGWIRSRFVRSPIDYRAGFVRRNGRWWLRALVAGD